MVINSFIEEAWGYTFSPPSIWEQSLIKWASPETESVDNLTNHQASEKQILFVYNVSVLWFSYHILHWLEHMIKIKNTFYYVHSELKNQLMVIGIHGEHVYLIYLDTVYPLSTYYKWKQYIKLEIESVMLASITAGTSRTQMEIKMFAENNNMHITFDLIYF